MKRAFAFLFEKRTLMLGGLVLTAAILGSALWYGRLNSFPVRAKLSAQKVNISLGAAGVIDPYREIILSSVRTFGAATARSIPELEGAGSGSFLVTGPVFLSAMRIPSGAAMSIGAVDPHCVDINVEHAPLQLEMEGDKAVLTQGAKTWTTVGPLTLESQAMQLCFAKPAELRIYELARFDVTETISPLPGAPLLASTLRSGSVSLALADRTFALESGEAIAISGFRGIASVKLGATSAEGAGLIDVSTSGVASAISAGAPGLERDLRPRWIEYLKARDVLGGLAAAILACWSVFSSIATYLKSRE